MPFIQFWTNCIGSIALKILNLTMFNYPSVAPLLRTTILSGLENSNNFWRLSLSNSSSCFSSWPWPICPSQRAHWCADQEVLMKSHNTKICWWFHKARYTKFQSLVFNLEDLYYTSLFIYIFFFHLLLLSSLLPLLHLCWSFCNFWNVFMLTHVKALMLSQPWTVLPEICTIFAPLIPILFLFICELGRTIIQVKIAFPILSTYSLLHFSL